MANEVLTTSRKFRRLATALQSCCGAAIVAPSARRRVMTDTFRTRVAAVCRRLPGAEVSDPWGGGHDAWKVGGKMFGCIGAVEPGVSVKTPDVETAAMLIDAGIGRRAAYFHRSWINLPEDTGADELAHRLTVSYRLVREKLPKKIRSALPPLEPQG